MNVNSSLFKANFLDFKNMHPLMQIFKNNWADNGDIISIQYSGTASCTTTVTKKGKHGIMGLFQHGLVSLTRIYQGNFEDDFKQKCIEIFLNKHSQDDLTSKYYLKIRLNKINKKLFKFLDDPLVEEEIKKQKHKFTTQEDLNIFIGSWNVGGALLNENTMLYEWLLPVKDMAAPDIYIIGLQEIVSLNAKNIVLSSNSCQVENWRSLIHKNLNSIENYILLKTSDLVGIFLIIFVKESLKENFRNIEALIVRTGLLGTMGNKGSCVIRFNYLDTSLAIACCHLAAGTSEVNSRISEMSEVITKVLPVKNLARSSNINSNQAANNNPNNYYSKYMGREIRFKDHDFQFLFGDLNFRVDLDMQTCLIHIKNKAYQKLAQEDQLNKKRVINFELMEMNEAPLNFDPTYKYIPGTSEYDTKKKRVPSWCDRILFRKNENISIMDYNKVDYTYSDHKPIYGLFKIKADKIDKAKKYELVKEIKVNIEKNLVLNGSKDIESN